MMNDDAREITAQIINTMLISTNIYISKFWFFEVHQLVGVYSQCVCRSSIYSTVRDIP
jgi:hypothetical protein